MTAADEHEPAETPEEAAFWSFSLAFYDRPGVAAACLALQDRHGLDVNLVLLCCWFGWSGRGRLDAAALAAADRRVAAWRRQVIQPLRTARRALKMQAVAAAAALRRDLQALELRAERVALELRAERVAQHLLLAGLSGVGGKDRHADAAANLALYLAAGGVDATAAADVVAALHNFD